MTQKFAKKNISYMIHPFPSDIIYSDVQTIAELQTLLIILKGNNFLL